MASMRSPFPFGSLALALALVPILAGASALTGCTPQIGDSCNLSTDCASDGSRVCDTAEPGGYCTILNCTGTNLGSTCPEYSICVLFNANVPGCPFSARSPSRIGQSECRYGCNVDSDCRAGYLCSSPAAEPWAAIVLDTNQEAKVCLPSESFIDGGIGHVDYGYVGAPDAVPPVCQAAGPTFDAGFPPLDAAEDADGAAHADAQADAQEDAPRADGSRDAAEDGRGSGVRDSGTKPHEAGARDADKDTGHDADKDSGHPRGDAKAGDAKASDASKDGSHSVHDATTHSG